MTVDPPFVKRIRIRLGSMRVQDCRMETIHTVLYFQNKQNMLGSILHFCTDNCDGIRPNNADPGASGSTTVSMRSGINST